MGGRRARRIAAWLIAAPLLAAGAALGALWIAHRQPAELPVPTGTYQVGRAHAVWVDSARGDPAAPSAASRRTLDVWAWYPADSTSTAPRVDYVPAAWRKAAAMRGGMFRSFFLSRDPAKVRAHAREGPPALASGTRFPVVLLLGAADRFPLDYTALAEDLASHGALVIGADAPSWDSLVTRAEAPVPDSLGESLLALRTADTRFLLDRIEAGAVTTLQPTLAGRADGSRIAVIGHAFGGATALQFCHDDPRCSAGVDLDGAPVGSVIGEGLSQPFLFLMADHDGRWRGGACPVCDAVLAVATKMPGDHRVVTLTTADHSSFTDQAVTESGLVRWARRRLQAGSAPGGPSAFALVGGQVAKFLGPIFMAPHATTPAPPPSARGPARAR